MKSFFIFLFLIVSILSNSQQPVIWENLKNISLVGSQYYKGAGVKGQMTSKNMLYGSFDENYNNGFITFTSGGIQNENKVVGFTIIESQEIGFEMIEYGFSFQNNKVKAFGRYGSFEQSISSESEFKVERFNDKMNYYINQIKVFEEKIDKTEFLLIRTILRSNNSTIAFLNCSFTELRPKLESQISNNKTITFSNLQNNLSIIWEDGSESISTKKYINTEYPFQIINSNNDFLQRSISVGKQVNWTNLIGLSNDLNSISKTSGNNWGSAFSSDSYNYSSSFWIENQIQFQNESKAIGISKLSTNVQNTTNIDAGFIIGRDFKLQLVFEGAVIRTIEAFNFDLIHLDYQNGALKWKLNGLIIEERTINLSESLRIIALLKAGTSLNKLYYSEIQDVITSSWQENSGSINFNISSINDIEGPFHYQIDQNPIPTLGEQYEYLRDSIYKDSILIDSLTFFNNMGTSSTNFQKIGLEMGHYYFSIFDHIGNRIYGGKITLLPEIILEQNSGIILQSQNKLVSTTNNAKTSSNLFFDETLSNGFFDYTVKNKMANQKIGLIDISNPSSIKYGFNIENGKVKLIDNNQIIEGEIIIGSNAILSIVKKSDNLFYNINGKTERIVVLGAGYILKGGFATDVLGIEIVNSGLRANRMRYTFSNNSTLASCDQQSANLKFKYNVPNSTNTILTFNYTISNISNNTNLTSGNLNPGVDFQMNNVPFGIYRIHGTVNTSPSTFISEIIVLGVKGFFNPVNLFDNSPNDYSLKKNTVYNSNNTTYASALSINQLISSDADGWITFSPVLQNNGECYIGFSNTNSLSLPINNYIRLSRILSSSYVSYILVDQNGNITNSGITQNIGKMALLISSSNIELNLNIESISPQFLSIPRPIGSNRLKVWAKQLNEGLSSIICSFICRENPPPLTLSQVGYAEMKRDIDAGYTYAVEGKVKFSFDEEYFIKDEIKLRYRIINNQNIIVAQCDENGISSGGAPIIDYNFDDYRYMLDISSITSLPVNEFFTIEITTIKGDKKYLKVLNKN